MAHDPPSSLPARLFAEHVATHGVAPEEGFEELCAAHPQHAPELRLLLSGWDEILEQLRIDPSVARALLSARPRSTDARIQLGTEMLEKLAARPLLVDRYTNEGEIARGGMGVILRVHDDDLDRHLAMKVIAARPEEADSVADPMRAIALSRFLEEAQITAQLDHPGIVPVHQVGIDGEGRVYFTMKLVKGRDLAEIFGLCFDQLEGWNRTRVLRALLRACEAMAYAHAKGVIHRDLKPANIMIGPFGEVYVMDWGLARVLPVPAARSAPPDETESGPGPPRTKLQVQSGRRQLEHESPDSPLNTMQGDVVGTPAYMSPEQAHGRLDEMGPQSDVYSMGAMLYHLLAGHMPYGDGDEPLSALAILRRVRADAPAPLATRAYDGPPEVLAITNKAMARAPEERYQDMSALAADLSAYLEGRVVGAYESGTYAELRKWIGRNKRLTTAFLGGVAALALGLVVSLYFGEEARRQRKNVLNLSALSVLDELEARADALWPVEIALEGDFEAWLADADRLVRGLDALEGKPGHRASLAELRQRGARLSETEFQAALEAHERHAELSMKDAELSALRTAADVRRGVIDAPAGAVPSEYEASPPKVLNDQAWQRVRPDRERYGLEAEGLALSRLALARVEGETSDTQALRAAIEDTLAWASFANGLDADALQHGRLAAMKAPPSSEAALATSLQSLEAAIETADGPANEARLDQLELEARRLRDEIEGDIAWRFDDDETAWWHAQLTRLVLDIEAFADPMTGLVSGTSPEHGWGVATRLAEARRIVEISVDGERAKRAWGQAQGAIRSHADYSGLHLPPQQGLLPMGPDPTSGLWEFAHVASGALPRRDGAGVLRCGADTCVVLVLVPGSSFLLGAQRDDENQPNFDPHAESDERPVHSVTLAPYFVSKYELTQAQWERFTGTRPSLFNAGDESQGRLITAAHPVESVSWRACERALGWFGLSLPSEAQWEYAARAGRAWPWYTGTKRLSLQGAENLADLSAKAANYQWPAIQEGDDLDDGHAVHAPVGSFSPNGFGLYDVLGNVREWCRDSFSSDAYLFPQLPESGERIVFGARMKTSRGGTHVDSTTHARVSYRSPYRPEFRYHYLGVRAVRGLD